MSAPTYAAVLQLPERQLLAAGRWPVAGEAWAWASALAAAGAPARLIAIVPYVEDLNEVAAALLAAVDR
jgi:hypothetical protein